MNSKAKKTAAKTAAKKAISENYNAKEAIGIARKNGDPTKVSTGKNGGEYTISSSSKSGTPILLRTIINENFPKAKTVSGPDILPILRKSYKGAEAIRLSKIVTKTRGTDEYRNIGFLSTLANRVEKGLILRFRILD